MLACKSMAEAHKNCGHPKLAEVRPVHQNCVPILLLLKPLRKMLLELIFSWQSGRVLCNPFPQLLDTTAYGWSQTEGSTILSPTTVPPETSVAHLDLLKLIQCSCQSQAHAKPKDAAVAVPTCHVHHPVYVRANTNARMNEMKTLRMQKTMIKS